MRTEKLYYNDAYIKDFSATVLSVERQGELFLCELDATAFFPEEGGQPADCGYIGEHRVVDVKECDGRIYHYTATEPECGKEYACKIDFERRLDRMRCHSAEHILCGIIHRLYGYDNVGFHLGDDIVTFDISEYLEREQLDEVERIANEIVRQCQPIYTAFPTAQELDSIKYRSKLDLKDGVRLVYIGEGGEVDICACCAPHVSNTGEIGAIKILDSMRHRGGVRITLQAGERAMIDYRNRYAATRRISELLCVPQGEVTVGVERLLYEYEALKTRMREMSLAKAKEEADSLDFSAPVVVVHYPDFSIKELSELVKQAVPRVSGMMVALCGTDADVKYIIYSKNQNLRELVKTFNADLGGKGGGKSEQVQGSFSAPVERVVEYFNNL